MRVSFKFVTLVLVLNFGAVSCASRKNSFASEPHSVWVSISDQYRLDKEWPAFFSIHNKGDTFVCGAAADFKDGGLLEGILVSSRNGVVNRRERREQGASKRGNVGYDIHIFPPGTETVRFNDIPRAFSIKSDGPHKFEFSVFLMPCESYFQAPFPMPTTGELRFLDESLKRLGLEQSLLNKELADAYGDVVNEGWIVSFEYETGG